MQKLFHGKFVTITKVQPFVETKIITIDVNVVDVNATTRGKATEEQMFKDRKLMKAKSVLLGEKKRLKKSMVETIQQIHKTHTQIKGPSTSLEGWNTTWPSMPNTSPMEAQKS